MNKKNIKEILAADALILFSLVAFGIVGFSEIGIIIGAGALGFVMLKGNMLSVVCSVALAFLADFAAGLSPDFSNGLIVCLCAFAINFAVRARMGLLSAIVAGATGVFAAMAILLSTAEIINVEGMVKLSDVRAFFEQMGDMVDVAVDQIGFDKLYTASELAKLKNLTSMIMVPVTFITTAIFISWGAIWVVKKMLKASKSDLASEIIGLSCIKADKMCLLAWVASLILFSSVAMNNQVIGAAAFCMLYLLSSFYLICGAGIMWYFAKRQSGIKKVLLAMVMIFAVLFMTPTVFIVGMIDSFLNIRKLKKGE